MVLVRSLFLIGLTAPALAAARLNPLRAGAGAAGRRWLLLLRGALGFCSTSSLYWAVSLLPMADATVLSFLAPIFVAALSPLALREARPPSLAAALPCCLAGVLLVARPAALFGGGGAGGGGPSVAGVSVGLLQVGAAPQKRFLFKEGIP